ncbi:hypothetical protein JK159_02340 [Weissella minor]|uniref:hypothetical protein n=1 Tax=Weissella minor TaxID=1620 RepID=UPI001BAEA2D3|nr:hypothetical protein [Weissella minor]MBS0949222.1 hypothetical protein [Weissella minor]
MSLNKKLNEEATSFGVDNKDQMQAAFAENPVQETHSIVPNAKELGEMTNFKRKERRMTTSYTLDPEIKEGIERLAKRNGFTSTSQYIEAVFKEILKATN